MASRLLLVGLALLCCASLGQGLTLVNEVDEFVEDNLANSRFFLDNYINTDGFVSNSVSLPALTTIPIGGASVDRDSMYAATLPVGTSFAQVNIQINSAEASLAVSLGNGAAWVAVDYDGSDGTPSIPTNPVQPDPADNPDVNGLNGTSFFTDGGAVGLTYVLAADHALVFETHFFEMSTGTNSFSSFFYPEPSSGRPPLTAQHNYADDYSSAISFGNIGAFRLLLFTSESTDFDVSQLFTFTNEVSGHLYVDCNANFNDDAEAVVDGYTVQLFECNSLTPIDSTTTDINGDYIFSVSDTIGGNPACYDVCIDTGSLSGNGLIYEPNGAPSSARTCYEDITVFDSLDNDFGLTDTQIVCTPANLDCSNNIGSAPTTVGDAGSPTIITLGPCVTSFTFTDTVNVAGTCNGQVSRFFTTQDNNAATCTQIISITDTNGPTIATAPSATVSIDCLADTSASANGEPTFVDDCNGPPNIIGPTDTVTPLCPGTEQISRFWQSVDLCDVSGASFTQTITTTDTTNPVVTAPADFTGPCNSVSGGVPTGTDDCSTVSFPSPSFSDSAVTNGPCGTSFIRTWVGQDGCGLTDSDTQLVTLSDTQPPTLTPPPDVTVSCTDSTAEGAPGIGTVSNVSDDCTAVTVLPSTDVVSVVNSCTTVVTRTWIAQDTCSTTSDTTVTQVITVVDDISPSLTVPVSITIECGSSTSTASLGSASAVDNCQGNLTPTSADTSVGDSCRTTISRAWTVDDGCVAPVTIVQTIVVDDGSAPTFTVPAGAALDCNADTSPASNGSPTAVNDCSLTQPATFTDTSVSDGCSQTITRRWTISDVCSNLSPAQIQTLVLTDSQAPTVSAPADVSVECGTDTSPGAGAVGSATASDNCASASTPVASDSSVGDNCRTTVTRTWSSTDGCQFGTSAQIIVVEDTQAPSISIPPPENVELCTCGLNCGTPATASDACQSSVSLSSSEVGPTPGPCGTVSRTWTANDNCGQTTIDTQTFTFVDSTNPTYNGNLVQPVFLECGADTSVLSTGTAQFSDCTTVTVTMVDVTIFQDDCDQQFQRTFFGTNECGGQSRFTQDINVSDNTAPTFSSFPGTITVECATSTDPFVINSFPTAADACQIASNVALTFSDVVSTLNSCTDIISRSWTTSDVCGNDRTQVQTVNVQDTVVPSINMPGPVTTECTGGNPGSYSPATFGTATGSDSCDPTSIVATFVDGPITVGGTPCTTNFDRTWTVVDTCGLSTSSTQQFTIVDTTPAQFATFPGAASLNCGGSSDPSATGSPTVTEVCTTFLLELTFSDGNPSGSCPATVARTWSVDDGCNAPTTSVQILTINDNIAPFFTNFPADNNNLECGASTDPSSTGAPGSGDTCTTATAPTFSDSVVSATNDCVVTVTRTWTTTDSCANTNSQIQTLTLRDTVPPPIGTFPSDSTIECGQSVPQPTATVQADACAPGTESVSVISTAQTGVCTQVFTRVYGFSDTCGNTQQRTETVTILDTTPPTIGTVPDTTVDCDDPRPIVLPSATDCDNTPSVTFTDVETSDNCPNDSIVRTFTAQDWCGLTSQSTTTITITNNLPPVVAAPPDAIVECGDSSDPSETGEPTVTHPCMLGFTVTFSDSSNGGDLCSELVTRTWSASDICGNGGSDTQILDISDNIEPDFTCFPDDVTVLCSESTDPFNTGGFPCATDECQGVVCLITYFDSAPVQLTPIGDCPADLVYTRTWLADDACGLQVSQNQLITVIFHEQAEDCPAEPCVAAPCELCECPVEAPCNCCAMGGITACSAVPCNPVPCSAVPCTAVDCEPCPPSSGTTVSPAQACGPEVPCIPNLRFVHNNDDGDGERRSTYVVDFGNLSASINDDDSSIEVDEDNDDDSASQLAGGLLAVLLPIVVLLLLN